MRACTCVRVNKTRIMRFHLTNEIQIISDGCDSRLCTRSLWLFYSSASQRCIIMGSMSIECRAWRTLCCVHCLSTG